MSEDLARVHDKIDRIDERGIRTETIMLGIKEKLESYQRPCPALVTVINDHEKEIRFWDGVKSKVLMFGISSAILAAAGAIIFALQNGYVN